MSLVAELSTMPVQGDNPGCQTFSCYYLTRPMQGHMAGHGDQTLWLFSSCSVRQIHLDPGYHETWQCLSTGNVLLPVILELFCFHSLFDPAIYILFWFYSTFCCRFPVQSPHNGWLRQTGGLWLQITTCDPVRCGLWGQSVSVETTIRGKSMSLERWRIF